MKGEPSNAAVQVPQCLRRIARCEGESRPVGGLAVQIAGHGGVRLDEGARPEGEIEVARADRQHPALGQDDLIGALDERLMSGVDIRRDEGEVRDEGYEVGQGEADVGDAVAGAQYEAAHECVIGSDGEEDVLELPVLGRNIVGDEVERADEALECGRGPVDRRMLDGTARKVDAAPIRPEDAEGGAPTGPTDDEFRTGAECRGRGSPR